MAELLKKNTLLEACITDRTDIFKEIRKIRRAPPSLPVTMDGVKSQIESHFGKVYERLYNSVDDKEGTQEVKDYLNKRLITLIRLKRKMRRIPRHSITYSGVRIFLLAFRS